MFRTAFIGSAIVAGCVIGGCKSKESSSNQAAPPAVTTPAKDAAGAAQQGANDAAAAADQAKIGELFKTAAQELTDLKIDDARDTIKTLQGMKDKMTPDEQTKLEELSTKAEAAHNATTAPAVPTVPPMH